MEGGFAKLEVRCGIEFLNSGGYGFKFLIEYITWFVGPAKITGLKKILCHVSLQRGSQILTIITDRHQSAALDKSVLYTE